MFSAPKKIIGFATDFIVERWNEYNSLGQFLFMLALVAIVCDAGICWEYGINTTKWHAALFALVAVVFAVLPDVSILELRKKNYLGGLFIGFACLPLAGIAYQSHVGYGSAIRIGDMHQAKFQNEKADSLVEGLKSERRNLDMLRAVFESRKAENDKIRARNNGWAVVTDPIRMKEQVAALDEYIAREAARGGCKEKCEAKKREKGDVMALIEGIKAENDATDKIASIQASIDAKEKAIAAEGRQDSSVANQVDVMGQLINIVSGKSADDALKVSAAQRAFTNTAIMGFNSFGFMLMGVVLMIGAGFNRKPEFMAALKGIPHIVPAAKAEEPKQSASAPVAAIVQKPVIREVLRLMDPRSACLERQRLGKCA